MMMQLVVYWCTIYIYLKVPMLNFHKMSKFKFIFKTNLSNGNGDCNCVKQSLLPEIPE